MSLNERVIQSPIPKIMNIVGNHHAYQIKTILLMAGIYFEVTSVIFGMSYNFMTPTFQCSFTTQIVNEGIACPRIKQCTIMNQFTISGAMGLYCEGQRSRALMQSAFPIGAFLGFILMNFICDIKGRRFSVIVALVFLIGGSLFTLFGSWLGLVSLIIISQTLSGFGAYSLMIIPYIIFYDVCEASLKQKAIIFMNVIWAFAETMFAFYAFIELKSGQFLIWIIIIPSVILLAIAYYFLLESPNFILEHEKNPQKCIQFLQKISFINHTKSVNLQQAQNLIFDYFNDKKRLSISRGYSYAKPLGVKRVLQKLFQNWPHIKPIFLLTTAYASVYLYSFGVQYSLSKIGYNYTTNMFVRGISNLFAFSTLQYYSEFIQTIERRKGFLISYSLMSAFGLLFYFDFIKSNKLICTLLMSVTRMLSAPAYIFFALLQTESFRSKVRSAGAGIIQGVAQIGAFVCPYVLTYFINHQIQPVHVLSLIMLVFISPVYFIDETLNIRNSLLREQSQMQQIDSQSLLSPQKSSRLN